MLSTFPPSYPYVQYNDDPSIKALIAAYNLYAQSYIDALNALNLPIYTNLPTSPQTLTVTEDGTYDSVINDTAAYNEGGIAVVGSNLVVGLLEWVLIGLYGISRPPLGALLSTSSTADLYNTFQYNTRQYNQHTLTKVYSYSAANDDIYKRVATWNLYKGDGYQFTGRWLKRRVTRFLTGTDGIDPGIDETYGVSVDYLANNAIKITCDHTYPGGANIPVLTELVASGALSLPFQYTFTVVEV